MPHRQSLELSLRQALTPSPPSPPRRPPEVGRDRRVVVVGVGSRLRSDDALGLEIAEKLAGLSLPGVHVALGDTAPENVTGEIRAHAPTHVLFVDAADLGETPGAARLVEAADIGGMTSSTHTLPLGVIADYLARELRCRVLFLGIQPETVAFGTEISARIREAIDEVIATLARALRA